MKYRSQWPTFIFRSNFGSYWLIFPKYGVHISNSLQDIRQNQWTIKCRSQWPTFIEVKGRVILTHNPKVWSHIRKNHWTVKYRSWWPSLHDLQVNVIRLTQDRSTICLSCFQNRKVEKTLFKDVLDFDLQPHPGARTLGSGVMKAGSPGYLWSKYKMLSDEWLSKYDKFHKLEHRTLTQCDTNTDADDRGDYNSSPCTSYRRAEKYNNVDKNMILMIKLELEAMNYYFCGFYWCVNAGESLTNLGFTHFVSDSLEFTHQ